MELEAVRLITVVAVFTIGTIVPALAIGLIGAKGVSAIGRNPEAGPKVQTAMILSIAFAEAIAVYALVISLVIKFVK